jgi:hypothetical protein
MSGRVIRVAGVLYSCQEYVEGGSATTGTAPIAALAGSPQTQGGQPAVPFGPDTLYAQFKPSAIMVAAS